MRNGQGHLMGRVQSRVEREGKKYWLYGNASLGFDGHGFIQQGLAVG